MIRNGRLLIRDDNMPGSHHMGVMWSEINIRLNTGQTMGVLTMSKVRGFMNRFSEHFVS